jgi:hypothetical protein
MHLRLLMQQLAVGADNSVFGRAARLSRQYQPAIPPQQTRKLLSPARVGRQHALRDARQADRRYFHELSQSLATVVTIEAA